ncbi:hypothetical protein SGLAM104S_01608 [Streptomyces glaucescens]
MSDPKYRTVSHTIEADDTLYVAVVERTPENEQMSDEEIIKSLKIWEQDQHLHPVDDE